jgi:hypothetical protein
MNNTCDVCGRERGIECVEVFGRIRGIECGCSGCIGVTHFPNFPLIKMLLVVPPLLIMWLVLVGVLLCSM